MPLKYHRNKTTLCLPYLVVDKAHDSAVIIHRVSRSKDRLQYYCCCALQDPTGAIQGEDAPFAINIKLIIGRNI